MNTRDSPSRASSLVRSVAEDILKAFETGTLPETLAQIFIRRDIEVASQNWTWTNRLIGALKGHVYAAGFRQWLSLGRHVRKGEHAFHILAPRIKVAREDDRERGIEAGDALVLGFLPVAVFGYLQTEGEPLPGADEEAAFIEELPLVEVARSWGLAVTTYSFEDSPGQLGFFTPQRGIGLGVENLSTWAHELVHAADYRLGEVTANKLAREVVAELGGAILLECLGQTEKSDRGGAYRYLRRYCEEEQKSLLQTCLALLDRTCRVVAFLLEEAEKVGEPLVRESPPQVPAAVAMSLA